MPVPLGSAPQRRMPVIGQTAHDAHADKVLLRRLREIAGRTRVFTGAAARPFETGYRFGHGRSVAVVRPGSLVAMWRSVQASVQAGAAVIVQAANTGLTGGSTPFGSYDRSVVIIS